MSDYLKLLERQQQLRDELESVEDSIREELSKLRRTVVVTKEENRYILDSPGSGKSIVVQKSRNQYPEFDVYWFNGTKKTELIVKASRASINDWRLWLAQQ